MLGRCAFAFFFLNLAVETYPVIFIFIMIISLTEGIRYPYYALKQLDLDRTAIGLFFGFFRYTLFLVLYPIGASFEVVTAFQAISTIERDRIMIIEMPNKMNFAFNIIYFIYSMVPIYLTLFPKNYIYMLR